MEFIDGALISLEYLGVFAYLVVFLIALADSTIIVGTFTTGAPLLFVAGVLVGRGVYSLPEMIVFAMVGAILGGAISFYLGRAQANFARKNNWLPKDKYLEKSAALLRKRGGASILLARFLGPISSVMAFVAGTAKMPQHRFHFWNVLAGSLWSTVFILLGYFLTSSLANLEVF